MGKTAFLFPGQGAQAVGMGRALAEGDGDIRALFQEADAVAGFSLSGLMFQGPDADLFLTVNTQPALVVTAVAASRLLTTRTGWRPDYVAGHSLGEYAAICVAGGFSFGDAIRLVQMRGRAMQAAVPTGEGAMAAMLNMTAEKVTEVCHQAALETKGVCVPANFNTPVQVVISGHKRSVDRAVELAKAGGAKRCLPLAVSAPFHCGLMRPAAETMATALKTTQMADLAVPLVANVTAQVVQDAATVKRQLVEQVTGAVLWNASIQRLVELGVDTFIELGTGRILTGMMKRINKGVRAFAVNEPKDLKIIPPCL